MQPWLLTPILDAIPGTPEAVYTVAHVRARNCIERCNGTLKSRFRCLSRHRVLNYSPIKAAHIIYACAVLHNISIFFNARMPDEDDQNEEDYINDAQNNDRLDNHNWLNEGNRIRNVVIHRYFQ